MNCRIISHLESHLQGFHIPPYIDMIDLQIFMVKEMEEDIAHGLKIIYHQGEDHESKDTETLCIEMTIKQEKWMVICWYKHHTNMSEHVMGELSKVADKALIQYIFITIIGDLNNNLLLPTFEVNKHLLHEFTCNEKIL